MVIINPIHLTTKSSNNERYTSICNNYSRVQHDIHEQFRICDRDKEITEKKAKRNATIILKTLKARNKHTNEIPFSSSKRSGSNESATQAQQSQYFDPSDVDILTSENDVKRSNKKDDSHFYAIPISQRFPNAKFDFEDIESFHQIVNNLDTTSPFYSEIIELLSSDDVRQELEREKKRFVTPTEGKARETVPSIRDSDSEISDSDHSSGHKSQTDLSPSEHSDNDIGVESHEQSQHVEEPIRRMSHTRNSKLVTPSRTPITSGENFMASNDGHNVPPFQLHNGDKKSTMDWLPPSGRASTKSRHQDMEVTPRTLQRHLSARSQRKQSTSQLSPQTSTYQDTSARSSHRNQSARSHRVTSSRRRSFGSSTHVMNLNPTEEIELYNDYLDMKERSDDDSIGFSDPEETDSYIVDELGIFANQDSYVSSDMENEYKSLERSDASIALSQHHENMSGLLNKQKSSFSAWEPLSNSLITGRRMPADFAKKKKVSRKRKSKSLKKKSGKNEEQDSKADQTRLNLLSVAAGFDNVDVELDFS